MTDMTLTQTLASRIRDRTMRGIALEVSALIRAGAIPVGMQLPPVRELAQALGVSPATVSGAWRQLRSYRIVSGTGRTGVWVRGDQTSLRPIRFEEVGNFGKHIVADLRFAAPDPALLPDLSIALAHGAKAPNLNSYKRERISAVFEEAVRAHWPYEPEALLATNGGFDALHLSLRTMVMPGAAVAVEDPSATRIFDILDKLGAHVIGVECDEHGPLPASLAAALQERPVAFVFQPRTHAVTGNGVSQQRFARLAELLAGSESMIVEDDGLGDIAGRPAFSLGSFFPRRTLHIRSYSKAFGPDLRLAVLSGPEKVVDQIQAYRNFGEGWTSRILQAAAAWMLNDSGVNAQVAHARQVYAQRREALAGALSQRGIEVPKGDALCLWIPVPSEQYALVTLAARGMAVTPGERFQIVQKPYIRVGTSLLTDDVDAVADAILSSTRGSQKSE